MDGKRLHLWVLKLALAAGIMLSSESGIVAQKQVPSQNPITSDTTAINKQKPGILVFINNLFHHFSKKSSYDYVRKRNKNKPDTTESKKSPKIFEPTKGSVIWTSLYTEGVNLNTGVNGLYNLGRLSQGFDIYGIPVTGVYTGVFNNGQFEKSYSGYSINFDSEIYLNGMKKKAEDILMDKRAEGKSPNFSDSMNQFESVRKQLLLPSFQFDENACKSQLIEQQDSAQMHPGSDTTELHNTRKKLAAFDQLEKRYQQLFAIKKNYGNIEKGDTAGQKYEKDEKSLSNPDNIEKVLMENHQLSPYKKLLMGVQKFSIGQNGEEISEFTLHNFMLNGLNVAYKSGDIYTYFGYGKQIAVVNPFLMTGINVPMYNRTLEFARVGEGTEESSNFYATIIKLADPGGTNSLHESNWIFDLSKQIVINKNLSFQGELAKSTFSYEPGKIDSAALPFTAQNNNTLAYAIRGKGIIPGLNTTIKSEFSQIGGDYVTLGNPYIINNATKYELEIIQPIGQKLNADVGGTHLVENHVSTNGVKQTDNWIQFSLRYKPTRLISMEFKYSPRQFQQETGNVYANNIASTINQISYTANMFNLIFGHNAITTIFAGNFQYNTTEAPQMLNQSLHLSYYMLGQLLMLSPTQGINLMVNESRNNWTGSLSQFLGQTTYNCNFSKSLMVAFGPQWLEQPGIIPNEIGVYTSLTGSVRKWVKMGIQCTVRNSAERLFDSAGQYLVSGTISVFW